MKYDNPTVEPIFDDLHATNWNTQEYWVNIQLYHKTGDPLDLTWTSVIALEIEEDLNTWGRRGRLLINDPNNTLLRKDKGAAAADPFNETEFHFKGNGEDFVMIDIRPCSAPQSPNDLDFAARPDQWVLHDKFTVTSWQPGQAKSQQGNTLLLELECAAKHFLQSTDWQWSTACTKKTKSLVPQQAFNADNNNRRNLTGDAIKALLRDAGFTANVVDEPQDIKTPAGDKAITSGGINSGITTVFYTSTVNNKIIDDLNYLLKYHTDERGFAIFKLDRSNNISGEPMHFSLQPFAFYVDQAGTSLDQPGPWQFESFFLTDDGAQENDVSINQLNPFNPSNDSAKTGRDYSFAYHNLIEDHHYNQRTAQDASSYTAPLTPTDSSSKQFDTTGQQPGVASQPATVGGESTVRITNDDMEGFRTATIHDPSPSAEARKSATDRTQEMSVFLNDSITFESKGLILRQPGRWITINRRHSNNENDFDYQLLGQWLLTNIKHSFSKETYTNTITAIKYFTFKKQTYFDDSNIVGASLEQLS